MASYNDRKIAEAAETMKKTRQKREQRARKRRKNPPARSNWTERDRLD